MKRILLTAMVLTLALMMFLPMNVFGAKANLEPKTIDLNMKVNTKYGTLSWEKPEEDAEYTLIMADENENLITQYTTDNNVYKLVENLKQYGVPAGKVKIQVTVNSINKTDEYDYDWEGAPLRVTLANDGTITWTKVFGAAQYKICFIYNNETKGIETSEELHFDLQATLDQYQGEPGTYRIAVQAMDEEISDIGETGSVNFEYEGPKATPVPTEEPKENYCQVDFETNGGSEIESQSVLEGNKVKKPAKPTKEGYAFDGWFADEELKTAFDFTKAVTEDITVFAKWIKLKNEAEPTEEPKVESDVPVAPTAEPTEEPKVESDAPVAPTAEPTEEPKVESDAPVAPTAEPTEEPKERTWSKASPWALEELDIANEENLIPWIFEKQDLTVNITRREFAYVAVKLYEAISNIKLVEAKENPFTDTEDIEVLKALNIGITNGTSETTFTPDALITREQMATMMVRALEKAGVKTTVDLNKVEKFADDGEMHDWGRASIYFMSNHEIIKGVGNNTFSVQGNATREASLLILVRSVDKFLKR